MATRLIAVLALATSAHAHILRFGALRAFAPQLTALTPISEETKSRRQEQQHRQAPKAELFDPLQRVELDLEQDAQPSALEATFEQGADESELTAEQSDDETSEPLAPKPLAYRLIFEAAGTGLAFFCANAISTLGLGATAMAFVWGAAIASAVAACSSASGAHFNPAVSLAFAADGQFPWGEVPAYTLAQYTGAAVAAICLGALPASFGLPAIPALRSEVAVTALLLLSVFSISDSIGRERIAGRWLPLLIGALITALNLAFSSLGAGLNPAMNAAARLAAAISAGGGAASALAGGAGVWTAGPVLGALLGGAAFALLSGRGQGANAPLVQLRGTLAAAGRRVCGTLAAALPVNMGSTAPAQLRVRTDPR